MGLIREINAIARQRQKEQEERQRERERKKELQELKLEILQTCKNEIQNAQENGHTLEELKTTKYRDFCDYVSSLIGEIIQNDDTYKRTRLGYYRPIIEEETEKAVKKLLTRYKGTEPEQEEKQEEQKTNTFFDIICLVGQVFYKIASVFIMAVLVLILAVLGLSSKNK